MSISLGEIALRLIVATVLGSLIGLERERAETSAGLRTYALVTLGAALFMIVSMYGFVGVLGPHSFDPSRVAAQVATGIGFLGAGTIILRRQIVLGLTTAASIWAAAAIGLAAGGGLFAVASVATALVLVVLAAMRWLERVLFHGRKLTTLSLTFDGHTFADSEKDIRRVLADAGAQVLRIDCTFDNRKDQDKIDIFLERALRDPIPAFEALRKLNGLQELKTSFEGSTV